MQITTREELKNIFSREIDDIYLGRDGVLVFWFKNDTSLEVIPILAINQYGIVGDTQLEYLEYLPIKGEEKDED